MAHDGVMRGGNAGRSGEWGACEWLGWDASSPAVQRIKAPSVALKYAKADADGVTVRRVTLGPRVRSVVISNSYGGQIGHHNRQLNDFRYRMVQPRVSVAAMLAANPALQRALARLVANPDSAIANFAFRQRLSAPVGPTGGVRFTGMPSPSGARVSVHLDDRGEVVVDRARGLQIGNWNTQRNQFAYQVSRPELGLGSVLRDRPDLARLLAMRYDGRLRASSRTVTGGPARSCAICTAATARARWASGVRPAFSWGRPPAGWIRPASTLTG
jgi:hypothetical protein